MLDFAIPEHRTIDVLWLVLCALMVLFMQGGFCLLESGLVRTKNTVNVAYKNLADMGIATILFSVVGFPLMYGASVGGWIGGSGFGFILSEARPWMLAFFAFQLMFCGTATTIISGAIAERVRLSSYLLIAVVVSALVYPVYGHWVWSELGGGTGWLKALGFVDFAGATVVHGVGGWVALAAVVVIGPRIGKSRASTVEIRGHNMTLATLGLFLLWFGWLGFNGGSALRVSDQLPMILVNTVIAAAAGGLTQILLSQRFSQTASLDHLIIGTIAGLVAITASCHAVMPGAAAVIGAVAGLLCLGATRLLDRANVDDVVYAFPSHAVSGAWGAIAVALFAPPERLGTGLDRWQQLGVQSLGVTVCALWAFGVGGTILWGINRIYPLRVSAMEERLGLNLAEHGVPTDVLTLLTELERSRNPHELIERVDPLTEAGQVARRFTEVIKVGAPGERAESSSGRRSTAAPAKPGSLVDETTQLANRRLFTSRLATAVSHARESARPFAVLYLNIDRFKIINHSLGNHAGDELLSEMAARIQVEIESLDLPPESQGERLVARVGGDEFSVLLDNVRGAGQIELAIERIRARLSDPYIVAEHEVTASFSVGVTTSEHAYASAEEVLRDATLAMRRAKASPLVPYATFTEGMRRDATREIKLRTDFQRTLHGEELELHYQPILSPETGLPVGFEALVRWDHPTEGLISPSEFVPFVEELGHVTSLGAWVLGTACRRLTELQQQYGRSPSLTMHVNVSKFQLVDSGFKKLIEETLAESRIPASSLVLEVTESDVVTGAHVAESLSSVKETGVMLAMDDFGTGYSSLGNLSEYPVDILKIDRSLVEPLHTSPTHPWILKTIVGLAHQLGMTVIAEGVENATQLRKLRHAGCDLAQGYLLGPPLAVEPCHEWLDVKLNGAAV